MQPWKQVMWLANRKIKCAHAGAFTVCPDVNEMIEKQILI